MQFAPFLILMLPFNKMLPTIWKFQIHWTCFSNDFRTHISIPIHRCMHVYMHSLQNINKHYGLVHKLEIGKNNMHTVRWAGERAAVTQNCVCMQHNEANTIIYKTPVGDMDFHSLNKSASKSIFKNTNPNADADLPFFCAQIEQED